MKFRFFMISAAASPATNPAEIVSDFRAEAARHPMLSEWLDRADFADEFGEYLLAKTSNGYHVVLVQFDEPAAVIYKLRFPDDDVDEDAIAIIDIAMSPARDLRLHPFQSE